MGAARRYLLYASEVYALAVLRPLERAVRERGGEAAWFSDGPAARHLRGGERRLRHTDDVRAFDPQAVLVPGNLVPDFFPGVKVQVFHGFSVGKRDDRRGHFRIRGLFDLYCTHGPTTTVLFRDLAERHGHFRVVETGWPKTDPLFRSTDPRDARRFEWSRPRPVVLYASTFTAALSSAPLLVDTIRDLARSGRWNWLVTLHPKMPRDIERAYRALAGEHLRFVETDDVVPLLREADVMVSDTSSIVFEFLLQRRPVVTFRNARPGPHLVDVREPGQIVPAVETALGRPERLMREISEFADRIHPYRDGRSSERVLAAIDDFRERHEGRLAPKPWNLWRRLKIRRRLGYYRWR